MKKLIMTTLIAISMTLSGCQSFQKDRDLEMYLVGGLLSYAIGKHVCRHSEFDENCGLGAAAAFVLWY
jgi:uncharacterized lipoprotein NlpE involved in copper resistance